jgi:hypothetical protein
LSIDDCRLRIEKLHFPDSGSRIDNQPATAGQSKIGNFLEVACWEQIVDAIAGIMNPGPEEGQP